MDKKRLRNSAICLVAAALSYLLVTEFMGELFGLAWHVRHGRTAHLSGLRGNSYDVIIPVLSWPVVDEGGWGLGIVRESGRLRSLLGNRERAIMSVSVSPLRPTSSGMQKSAPWLKDNIGVKIIEVASFSVAGQELHCFELKEQGGELAEIRRINEATIECVPTTEQPGFSARFNGSRTLIPPFYALLHSVKRSNQ